MAGAAGRVLKEGVVGVANMTGSVLPSMGGAVDIVVVRQKDGSFRSSPFYGASIIIQCSSIPEIRMYLVYVSYMIFQGSPWL